jgi:hypothetical protein
MSPLTMTRDSPIIYGGKLLFEAAGRREWTIDGVSLPRGPKHQVSLDRLSKLQ